SAGADDGEMDMNGQNKTSRGGCGGKGHLPWGWARERAWALGQELTPDPRELPLDQVTGGVLGADVRGLGGLAGVHGAAWGGVGGGRGGAGTCGAGWVRGGAGGPARGRGCRRSPGPACRPSGPGPPAVWG